MYAQLLRESNASPADFRLASVIFECMYQFCVISAATKRCMQVPWSH
jgi:hypothetical protein